MYGIGNFRFITCYSIALISNLCQIVRAYSKNYVNFMKRKGKPADDVGTSMWFYSTSVALVLVLLQNLYKIDQ